MRGRAAQCKLFSLLSTAKLPKPDHTLHVHPVKPCQALSFPFPAHVHVHVYYVNCMMCSSGLTHGHVSPVSPGRYYCGSTSQQPSPSLPDPSARHSSHRTHQKDLLKSRGKAKAVSHFPMEKRHTHVHD